MSKFSKNVAYRDLMDSVIESIFLIEDGICVDLNEKAADFLMMPRDEIIGKDIDDILIFKEKSEIASDNSVLVSFRLGSKSNDFFYYTIVLVKNEKKSFFLISVDDFKEIRKTQEKLEKLALFDQLTELKNRRFLFESYEIEASKHRRSETYGALIFMDLDSFKQINDIYGHTTGDTVLKEIANRIKNTLRKNDIPCRYGGDEFVILIDLDEKDAIKAAQKVEIVTMKLISAISKKIVVNVDEFNVSTSIGISLFGGSKKIEKIDNIIRYADNAMYKSKKKGKNIVSFSNLEIQKEIEDKATLLQDLKEAIVNKEITLFFQPQVNNAGNIIGAEALARWIKNGKITPPAQFIPLAEESGLIDDIGYIVLEKAIETLQQLQKNPKTKEWTISVNASTKQFLRDDFFNEIKNLIKQYKINTSKLIFEITEGIFVENIQKITQDLKELQKMGISISIDNFGTSYSSLSYVKTLPIDELKIDQSFIIDEILNEKNLAIVKTILTLSKELGYVVVIEGIESKEQYDVLKSLDGEQFFQGYLFAKPMPLSELKKFKVS